MNLQTLAPEGDHRSALEEYLDKVRAAITASDCSDGHERLTAKQLERANCAWRLSVSKVSGHLTRLVEKNKLRLIHESRQERIPGDQRLAALIRSNESNAR